MNFKEPLNLSSSHLLLVTLPSKKRLQQGHLRITLAPIRCIYYRQNSAPDYIGQVWKSCRWHTYFKKRDQKNSFLVFRGEDKREGKRKGVDGRKDRLQLFHKSCLLFSYSQQDRPVKISPQKNTIQWDSSLLSCIFNSRGILNYSFIITWHQLPVNQTLNLLGHKTFILICLLWSKELP